DQHWPWPRANPAESYTAAAADITTSTPAGLTTRTCCESRHPSCTGTPLWPTNYTATHNMWRRGGDIRRDCGERQRWLTELPSGKPAVSTARGAQLRCPSETGAAMSEQLYDFFGAMFHRHFRPAIDAYPRKVGALVDRLLPPPPR